MRVIFLDRDGVINEYPGDRKFVTSWEEFKFIPKSLEALTRLTKAGFNIFVISNQSGISKGIYSQKSLDDITLRMSVEAKRHNAKIKVFYCTHKEEDSCNCRKPRIGLIKRALESIGLDKIDLNSTFLIGDSIRDIQTGKNAGLKTILVLSGKEKLDNKNDWQVSPDFIARNLNEAVDLVLKKLC
jgi:histidinol-phosphate phosphatase family protein